MWKTFFVVLVLATASSCKMDGVCNPGDTSNSCGASQSAINALVQATIIQSATPACDPCRVFVTNLSFSGNLGGVAGADSKCSADTNKPSTGTYKAFLADTSTRIACTTSGCSGGPTEHTNWVLQANRNYVRASDTASVATTDSNGLFPTTPYGEIHATTLVTVWAGLAMSGSYLSNSSNCVNWTDGLSGSGGIGPSNNVSGGATNGGACGGSYPLICAQQ